MIRFWSGVYTWGMGLAGMVCCTFGGEPLVALALMPSLFFGLWLCRYGPPQGTCQPEGEYLQVRYIYEPKGKIADPHRPHGVIDVRQ